MHREGGPLERCWGNPANKQLGNTGAYKFIVFYSHIWETAFTSIKLSGGSKNQGHEIIGFHCVHLLNIHIETI